MGAGPARTVETGAGRLEGGGVTRAPLVGDLPGPVDLLMRRRLTGGGLSDTP